MKRHSFISPKEPTSSQEPTSKEIIYQEQEPDIKMVEMDETPEDYDQNIAINNIDFSNFATYAQIQTRATNVTRIDVGEEIVNFGITYRIMEVHESSTDGRRELHIRATATGSDAIRRI